MGQLRQHQPRKSSATIAESRKTWHHRAAAGRAIWEISTVRSLPCAVATISSRILKPAKIEVTSASCSGAIAAGA